MMEVQGFSSEICGANEGNNSLFQSTTILIQFYVAVFLYIFYFIRQAKTQTWNISLEFLRIMLEI